jgi:hypothetical protein
MAGSGTRGSISGLRAGPGSLSYASSADSRDHGAHRRGQQDPSPIHIEARAGAVLSHEEWEGNHGAGGPSDRVQRHQTGDGAIRAWTRLHPHRVSLHHTRLPDSAGMDLTDDTNLANKDGTRPRGHSRRQGQGGAGRGARGGQQWHPRRRPAHSSTQEEARRHFHAGRTPGPHWGRGPPHSARR